jgi:homoserine O-acetyltransferase/O-succinyltransferase
MPPTISSPVPSPIGTVESRFFTYGGDPGPVALQHGEMLPSVTLAYETYGALNADRDNAILLFHALSGSQHAAGFNPSVPGVGELWTPECRTGWWDDFIGPGLALNTNRFFVVCANYLGGCYGSTGPSSVNPLTGARYAGTFPRVTLADIVDSQVRLLDALGIEQLHAVIGGSLGGMMGMSLATRYPNRVRIVIPIASACDVTSLQRIFNLEQIYAIESDPAFQYGDYYNGPRPDTGLCAARMISHKSFVSLTTLEERARGEILSHVDDFHFYRLTHPIESYMLHQGRKFVKRFDANTYLRFVNAWSSFDLAADAGAASVTEAFAACAHHRYLVFSIDSDVCFYPDQQATLTQALKSADVPHRRITVHSEKGHDAFLLEPELLTPHLTHALEKSWS